MPKCKVSCVVEGKLLYSHNSLNNVSGCQPPCWQIVRVVSTASLRHWHPLSGNGLPALFILNQQRVVYHWTKFKTALNSAVLFKPKIHLFLRGEIVEICFLAHMDAARHFLFAWRPCLSQCCDSHGNPAIQWGGGESYTSLQEDGRPAIDSHRGTQFGDGYASM